VEHDSVSVLFLEQCWIDLVEVRNGILHYQWIFFEYQIIVRLYRLIAIVKHFYQSV